MARSRLGFLKCQRPGNSEIPCAPVEALVTKGQLPYSVKTTAPENSKIEVALGGQPNVSLEWQRTARLAGSGSASAGEGEQRGDSIISIANNQVGLLILSGHLRKAKFQ